MRELNDMLLRPRISRNIYKDWDIEELIALLRFRGVQVFPTTNLDVCRDPNDNKFLELAVDGLADYIVGGDKDLLILHPFRDIPIVTPAEFLELLEKQ
jgi:putative PIN family toxin of toxin-antitoxin system